MQWTSHKTKISAVMLVFAGLIIVAVEIKTRDIPLSDAMATWLVRAIVVICVLLGLTYVRLVDKK